jgi:hypothetical protein
MSDAVESNPRNGVTVVIGVLLLATALTLNYLSERHFLLESWGDLFFPTVCFLLFVIDKFIFHPVVFSPRQGGGGVVYGVGKMLPPPIRTVSAYES